MITFANGKKSIVNVWPPLNLALPFFFVLFVAFIIFSRACEFHCEWPVNVSCAVSPLMNILISKKIAMKF